MEFIAKHRGLIVPVGFIALLGVLIVPLPPIILDVLIVANIAISVMILMTTIYMKEPLDFSVFPSLLLAVTLFRLVLNVATTRLILGGDATTPEEAMQMAGGVIAAFGEFVAGSSLVVGVVIFLILIVVQFVVITKGATRISEVAARFTLDAMPGKQMAIDADLAAGIINEAEARKRRERIASEADFFGAMDGASKFVRGDAIAGLIITAVNIIGGITIGMVMKDWDFATTARIFTLLTIGDGITSQLTAFVVSIASALIVTRSGSKEELGTELTSQLVSQPIGLVITAGFLLALTLTPLPTLPLAGTGAVLLAAAWFVSGGPTPAKRKAVKQKATEKAEAPAARPEPPAPESLLKLDTMELEVGYGLVAMVDTNQGGDLLDRISAIRRQLAVELGFIMPPVRIRDNVELGHNEYRIKIKGAVIASGITMPGKMLAINSGAAQGHVDGLPGRDPAFGLDATWIERGQAQAAESQGFMVADATSVLATHISEVVKTNAGELLTRQEITDLVTQLKNKAPKLVEDTIPGIVKPGDLHRILQNLLKERVSIRDLESIIETLADWAPRTKDLDVLTEYVRNGIRRSICQRYCTRDDLGRQRLSCVTLDPALEDLINSYIDRNAAGTSFGMPGPLAQQVAAQLGRGLAVLQGADQHPVILTSPQVRAIVRQLVESSHPAAAVLSYNEIVPGVELESLALVGPPQAQPARAAA